MRLLMRIVIASAVIAGLSVTPASANIVDLQRQLQENQRLFEQTQRNIQNTQQNLSVTEQEIRALESELARIQSDLRRTEEELARLNHEVQQAELRVEDAREDLRRTEEELEFRTELMRVRVRAMNERGSISYLEVLLSSTSFYEFLSRMELLRQVVRADVELFHYVSNLRDQAERQRNELEEELDQLGQLRDRVAQKRHQLDTQIASRQSTLSRVNARYDLYERQLRQLEEDSELITQMILKFEEEIEAYRRQGELAFIWPLQNPRGWISSSFGMRYHPILRSWRLHTGVDIAAPQGTSIVAAEEGRVTYAGWLGGYGLTIIIDHGGRVSSLYAHASRLLVSANQVVSRGELIARVGTTGLSTGPHLHFEIRINGEVVDPMRHLP